MRSQMPQRRRDLALPRRDEEVRTHREANADHEPPHLPKIGFLRVMRPELAPCENACDHHRALPP